MSVSNTSQDESPRIATCELPVGSQSKGNAMPHKRIAPKSSQIVCPNLPSLLQLVGHFKRHEILQHLAHGPSNVTDLVDVMGLGEPDVSDNLGDLFEAGVIVRDKKGKHR